MEHLKSEIIKQLIFSWLSLNKSYLLLFFKLIFFLTYFLTCTKEKLYDFEPNFEI